MRTRTLLLVSAVLLGLCLLAFPDLAMAADEGHAAEAAAHAAGAAAGGDHGGDHHGPPWVSLGLHAFNLALLLGLIGWFAGPRIKGAMKSRAAEVKREIDASNRQRKEAREAFEELEARLAGFEQKLQQMRADAEREAGEERAAILARGERDAQRLQEAAERTIRSETAKARMALRKDAVDLAMKLAEDRIAGQVTAADDQRISAGFFRVVDDAQTTEVPNG